MADTVSLKNDVVKNNDENDAVKNENVENTEKPVDKTTNVLGYVLMIVIIVSLIIYFVIKLKDIKGDEFKPWLWPYSFWSGFYLWNETQYVINPDVFMKVIIVFIMTIIIFSCILTSCCWFYDRVLGYPKSEAGEDGDTKGFQRWKLLYSKLIVPSILFVFSLLLMFLIMKPNSESWSIMITLFFVMSSIGIAFQKATMLSWFVGLVVAFVSFFLFMPASYSD